MSQTEEWSCTRNVSTPAREEERRISEEGMKRIIAATKKRWAAESGAGEIVSDEDGDTGQEEG